MQIINKLKTKYLKHFANLKKNKEGEEISSTLCHFFYPFTTEYMYVHLLHI